MSSSTTARERLLLDTTFLINAEHSGDTLDESIADDDDIAIAAITVAELWVGVELTKGRRRVAREQFVGDASRQVRALQQATRTHSGLRAPVDERGVVQHRPNRDEQRPEIFLFGS